MNRRRIFSTFVLLVAASAFVTSAPASSQGVASTGTLFFSEDNNSEGLYSLNTTDATATNIGTSGVTSSTNGIAPSESPDFLFGSLPFGSSRIATDGSGITNLGSAVIEGMAYDPATDTIYSSLNGSFRTIDTTSGEIDEVLTNAPFDVEGLAWRTIDEQVYGVGDGTELVAYDPVATTWSTIGDTGIDFDSGGLAWDSAVDVLYAIDGTGVLYSIDPADATTTEIGDTGLGNGGGLAYVAGEVVRTISVDDVDGVAGDDVTVTVSGVCAGPGVDVTIEIVDAADEIVGTANVVTNASGEYDAEVVLDAAEAGSYEATATCVGGTSEPASFDVAPAGVTTTSTTTTSTPPPTGSTDETPAASPVTAQPTFTG